jgi:hypothetical protein
MMQFSFLTLLAWAFLAMSSACKSNDQSFNEASSAHSDTQSSSGTSEGRWLVSKYNKETELEGYLEREKESFELFSSYANGKSGLPWVVFMVLPEVMPDLWKKEGIPFNFPGLHRNPFDPEAKVPLGLGFADDFSYAGKAPDYQIVNISCGACHIGRVKTAPDKILHLVGAPNNQFSFFGFLQLLNKTVNDPRFTIENFKAAWNGKNKDFFGIPNALNDIQVLSNGGSEAISQIQAALIKQYAVFQYMSGTMYAGEADDSNSKRPHMSRMIGAFDAYGVAAMGAALAHASSQGAAQQTQPLFPPSMPADLMAVWMQRDRPLAQWDNTLELPLTRNLAAAVASVGDRTLLDVNLSARTAAFLNDLPPPVYPFPLDDRRISRGQQLAKQYCHSCHYGGNKKTYSVGHVGTSPNRAQIFTLQFRENLARALQAACTDQAFCEGVSSNIVVPARNEAELGYAALPFHGVWATAPYLHNGSVPTLYHLLVPSERPKSFYRGSLAYDQQKMGFAWQDQQPGLVLYNTDRDGQSNSGHDTLEYLGQDWGSNKEDLKDLLAYLATQ